MIPPWESYINPEYVIPDDIMTMFYPDTAWSKPQTAAS